MKSTVAVLEFCTAKPLLLRRVREKPQEVGHPVASHMTVCTTQGFAPEMHDQWEDSTRYDQD